MPELVSAPPSTTPVAIPRPEIGPVIGLGWSMADLYRAPAPTGGDEDPDPPDRLPGMTGLRPRDRFALGLRQIDVALALIAGPTGFSWAPGVIAPSTADSHAMLDATKAPGAGKDAQRALHQAIAKLHVDLFTAFTASDDEVGKAYGLGLALADTCRRGQSPAELRASFRPDVIHEIIGWIVDLTSVLPQHAGHSVGQSVERWAGVAAQVAPPGEPQPAKAGSSAHKQAAGLPAVTHSQLAFTVHRQGQLWRSLLTGEKEATDLLLPDDYVRATQQLVHRIEPMVKKIVRSLRVPLLVLGITALLVIVFALLVRGSAAARLTAALVAAGGALGSGWRMISPRATRIMAQVEQPLWGAELDAAIAEAVTLPPVGAGDPAGALALVEAAVAAVVDLRDSQGPAPADVQARTGDQAKS